MVLLLIGLFVSACMSVSEGLFNNISLFSLDFFFIQLNLCRNYHAPLGLTTVAVKYTVVALLYRGLNIHVKICFVLSI